MDSRKKSTSDRFLISEQPGLTVLVAGLLFSFVCGYAFRSYFSPSRVGEQIDKAAKHMHSEVKVQFSEAALSLSDGIFPRFSVVISKVQLESDKKCWASPKIEIDELRLPLSVSNLFLGTSSVQRIEMNKMKILLREDPKDCTAEAPSPAAPASGVVLKPAEPRLTSGNALSLLSVEDLEIVFEKHPEFSFDLMNFKINVKSHVPKIIELKAQTQLLKDQQVGDYLSHANLFAKYKESPQETLQAHFFGNWREGHYSLITNYNFEDKQLSAETDLKHIPLSQILVILQKYDLAAKNINGRQAWISGKAQLTAAVDQIRSAPLSIRELSLEGDVGEMNVDEVKVQSIDPFKFDPIRVDIKRLDISKLLQFLGRAEKPKILNELGTFSGRAEVQSDRKLFLTGEHTGLEFIFSNNGTRQMQTIDKMTGNIELIEDQWSFHIHRLELHEGLFSGAVAMTADRDFRDVEVKAKIDELSLAPSVQKLMTGEGAIGPLSMDLKAQVQDGELSYLKGGAHINEMTLAGMNFGDTKAVMNWGDGGVLLNLQLKSLMVDTAAPTYAYLKQVTRPEWWDGEALHLDAMNGAFKIGPQKSFSWKGVQGKVGKSGKFITDGAWTNEGSLSGFIGNREGKLQKKWMIQGHRDQPTFVEELKPQKVK